MGFVWSSGLEKGLVIKTTHTNEMRTNLDSVYSWLGITYPGCISGAGWQDYWPVEDGAIVQYQHHNAVRDRADYADENFCVTHQVGVQSGDYGIHYPDYHGTFYEVYHNEHDLSDLLTDKGGAQGEYFVTHRDIDYGDYHSGDEGTYNDGFKNGYDSLDVGNFHTSYDTVDRGSYDGPYDYHDYGTYNGTEKDRNDSTYLHSVYSNKYGTYA